MTRHPLDALIVLFSLEELRSAFGGELTPGADPRHDTRPFQAFRARLLEALARRAVVPAEVGMWWEGSYNGYALAVAVEPAGAVPGLEEEMAEVCPVDASRLAPPRRERYPLARVVPGRAEVARDAEGFVFEAPLGAATGHFGAPGMRRLA